MMRMYACVHVCVCVCLCVWYFTLCGREILMCHFSTGNLGAVANGVVHGGYRAPTYQLSQLLDGVIQGTGMESTCHCTHLSQT